MKIEKVEWIKEDYYIGPNKFYCAIKKGEIRTVLGYNNDKTKIMVTNRTGDGFFGWCDSKNFKKVNKNETNRI